MSKYTFPLVVALCLFARAAFAQSSAPAFATDPAASAELAKIVEATRAKGLPVDPILAEARYAITVHAQPSRIVAIARDMAARLEVAREALAPHPIPNDIRAGEEALHYVPRSVLTDVRRASPPDSSVAVPLGVLVQLVTGGQSVKRAAQMVTWLVSHGASGQQLASFSSDVNSDVQNGGRPDDALNVRMRGLSAVLAPAGASSGLATAVGTMSAPAPVKPKGRP
jgi:hypothetical protein